MPCSWVALDWAAMPWTKFTRSIQVIAYRRITWIHEIQEGSKKSSRHRVVHQSQTLALSWKAAGHPEVDFGSEWCPLTGLSRLAVPAYTLHLRLWSYFHIHSDIQIWVYKSACSEKSVSIWSLIAIAWLQWLVGSLVELKVLFKHSCRPRHICEYAISSLLFLALATMASACRSQQSACGFTLQ